MSKTISMSVGRLAPLHDVRRDISANVDSRLTYRNAIFIDKLSDYDYSIEAYTDAKFQDAIDEYNRKQVREDRKKKRLTQSFLRMKTKSLLKIVSVKRKKASIFHREGQLNSHKSMYCKSVIELVMVLLTLVRLLMFINKLHTKH